MEDHDNKLYNNSEKLKYILTELLKLPNSTVEYELELVATYLSKLFNDSLKKLKRHHLLAISQQYYVPMEIFDNKKINTKEEIRNILNYQKKEVFTPSQKVLNALEGEWYAYTYKSHTLSDELHEVKTTFSSTGHVIDQYDNEGYVQTGKNQSLIIKEAENSQNVTTITFDNTRVTYGIFIISLVSKSVNENRELFNFGLYSRKKIDLDEVKKILGTKNTVQVKINYDVLERINVHSIIK